jgi:hypothetical protein
LTNDKKDFPGEQWKTVWFDFEFTNDFRLEVSSFGRLRTFNKVSDGNLIKGSMINGYRIVGEVRIQTFVHLIKFGV